MSLNAQDEIHAPSPRPIGGLGLTPGQPALPSTLRRGSSPTTPPDVASLGLGLPSSTLASRSPGTPGTPPDFYPSRSPSTRALSLSLARRASVASLCSEDGIDVSKLDLRSVYTPPPGSSPLPELVSAHPHTQSPAGTPNSAALPIHHHHATNQHQHRRRSSSTFSNGQAPASAYAHGRSVSAASSTPHSAAGSVAGSPLLTATPCSAIITSVPAGPTLAETGLRLSPDCSHASGQLERKSPRPCLVRLDSFGGEGLERKPSSRRNTDDIEEDTADTAVDADKIAL
jgi:hypothetical protein